VTVVHVGLFVCLNGVVILLLGIGLYQGQNNSLKQRDAAGEFDVAGRASILEPEREKGILDRLKGLQTLTVGGSFLDRNPEDVAVLGELMFISTSLMFARRLVRSGAAIIGIGGVMAIVG
jgi:hypothetical protein